MKKAKNPPPTPLELEPKRRRDASERVSCGIGVDDQEPKLAGSAFISPERPNRLCIEPSRSSLATSGICACRA